MAPNRMVLRRSDGESRRGRWHSERSDDRARGKRARPVGSAIGAECGRAGADRGRARARRGSGER